MTACPACGTAIQTTTARSPKPGPWLAPDRGDKLAAGWYAAAASLRDGQPHHRADLIAAMTARGQIVESTAGNLLQEAYRHGVLDRDGDTFTATEWGRHDRPELRKRT